jgi:urocanate hydratase
MVVVATGDDEGHRRIERVLRNDPAMGVIRHSDAGYEIANRTAREKGVKIPMLEE